VLWSPDPLTWWVRWVHRIIVTLTLALWNSEATKAVQITLWWGRRNRSVLFKIYRTFKQTMIKANIRGAFQEVGFEFDTSREPYRLRSNKENCEEVRGFRKFMHSTSLLRNCRHTTKKRGLDGLINLIKWEWSPLSLIWSSKYRDIRCFQKRANVYFLQVHRITRALVQNINSLFSSNQVAPHRMAIYCSGDDLKTFMRVILPPGLLFHANTLFYTRLYVDSKKTCSEVNWEWSSIQSKNWNNV
jgi:hypothetical protein